MTTKIAKTKRKGVTRVGSNALVMPLPPLTNKPLMQVDATPDKNYPLRILRTYWHNAKSKWVQVSGKPVPIMEAMNKMQDERAAILWRAIKILEKELAA